MLFYLSSEGLGDSVDKLLGMLGRNRRAAIILNAKDYKTADERAKKLEKETELLESIGVCGNEVDLRDYFGNPTALENAISSYNAVWVPGGNVFLLRRAFAASGLDRILEKKAGDPFFVYAGYSAGCCVLSPTLEGYEITDPPHVAPSPYNPDVIWKGLGLVPFQFVPHNGHGGMMAKMRNTDGFYGKNRGRYWAVADGGALALFGGKALHAYADRENFVALA
ncbi:MAG: peptidase E [Alphaproteobacteria bacterium]|nr:peptidase E [Alphaproteobacteria bacterium]